MLWVQLAFQSCLEDLEPPVSSRCTYGDTARRIPDDPAFRILPDAQRRAVFEEVRLSAASVEEASPAAMADASAAASWPAEEHGRQEEAAPAPAAAAAAPVEGSRGTHAQEKTELDALRQEQVWAPLCWRAAAAQPRGSGSTAVAPHESSCAGGASVVRDEVSVMLDGGGVAVVLVCAADRRGGSCRRG